MTLNQSTILLIILTVLTSGAFAAASEGQADGSGNQQISVNEQQRTNLGIKTEKLRTVQEVPLLYAPGRVVIPPDNDYIVSAAQSGLVKKLKVAIGDRVEQGQVLAVINSPEILALQRQYLKAVSERQLAEGIFRRDNKLLEEGVIAGSRFEQSKSRLHIAESEANESVQLLRIAGMSEHAIEQLTRHHRLDSDLEVLSPITGVVLDKMVAVGTRISGQTPIYRVADIGQLWLEINIPQERIRDIKIGDRVLVEQAPVKAEISLLGRSVDPTNQTILARAVIVDGQDSVRPGQSVSTKIVKSADKPAFKVPNEALAQREGRSYVFVRNNAGFEVVEAEVIGKQDDESIITGAFRGDEVVAVHGGVALKAIWLGLGSEE
ncbi:MAG: efflux RND transporter periplasmic adaptor subunit [Gammaproteobacteria bacterium]